MNPRLRGFLWVALPVAVLALLNPGYDEFYAYIQQRISTSGNSAAKPLRDMMSGISAKALNEAQEKGAARKNYVIFSVFEIRNEAEGKVHRILGFGKKIFIPLNETPKWEELKLDFGG